MIVGNRDETARNSGFAGIAVAGDPGASRCDRCQVVDMSVKDLGVAFGGPYEKPFGLSAAV